MTARFATPIMLGAESALGEIDLSLITADARGDAQRFGELVRLFNRRHVDGVMVIGDNNHYTPSVTALSDAPVVYVYGRSDDDADIAHLVDDEYGGRLLARHLLETGRTRIAHITGPRGSTAVEHRLAGVRAALEEADARLVGAVAYGEWSQRVARIAADHLLTRHPDIDAVLCGSDQLAAGVVAALRERRRRIPAQVAVTGWDNWEPFAIETDPALTTIDMNLSWLGQAAAQDLFTLIEGKASLGEYAGVHRHEPHLVVRCSTAP